MSKVSVLESINPHDGKLLARYPVFSLAALDGVLLAADQAQQDWRALSVTARADYLRALATALRARSESLAVLASAEMGKTLVSARAEVEKCAWVCEYYAGQAADMLADHVVDTDDYQRSYYSYRPLGIILAVMPWNFPFWQVFRFLVPALMAGNGVVLKHASNVSGCAVAIERLMVEAGMPAALFHALLLPANEVVAVIDHPLVRAVTFTGSTAAGRSIAATAGRALKKTVLELGGSDPYLVLADADLDLAVAACVASRLINNGQGCIAAKRFIVHDSRYGEFAERMSVAMAKARVGDPMDEQTELGPLARRDLCRDVAAQVAESVRVGAVLMTGGQGEDNFYQPTVLTEVRPGMPAFDEEVFGPVAALVRARSDEEAVALANQSEFGLGSAIFSQDVAKAERLARDQLDTGCCFINDFVKSDPRLPFGGIKASGYGRELGVPGIREFTNIKTIVCR